MHLKIWRGLFPSNDQHLQAGLALPSNTQKQVDDQRRVESSSMTASIQDFPVELEEHLLGFLQGDVQALRNAALTCRRWLAACREYMFRDVTIETKAQYLRFEKAVEASPMIQNIVRTLSIDKRMRKYELAYPWVNDQFSPILPRKLKYCHTFTLAGVDEVWKFRAIENLIHFSTIRTLVLIKCGLSPPELYALIAAFQNLKSLWVEHYVDLLTDRKDDHVRFFEPSLERLDALSEGLPSRRAFLPSRANHDIPRSFYSWLLSTPTKQTLRSLSLEVGRREIEDIGEFLRELGPVIETLELRFVRQLGRREEDMASIVNEIDLSYNSGVKTLILPNPSHPPSCVVLGQLTTAKIEHLTFRIRCYQSRDIEHMNHAQLKRLLEQPHLQRLKELCFADEGDFPLEQIDKGLRDEYTSLAERGILRVEKSGINTYP